MADRILTKTLANLYIQQGHLRKAYEILQKLLERNPSDRDLIERLAKLKEKMQASNVPGEASHPHQEEIQALSRWLENVRRKKTA